MSQRVAVEPPNVVAPKPSHRKPSTARLNTECSQLHTRPEPNSSEASIDLVYLLSASHSGSTLLTMLLARHPLIATVGETSAVSAKGERDVGLCSCGVDMSTCEFWNAVRRIVAEAGVAMDKPGFSTEYRAKNHQWLDRILRAEYRHRWLEGFRDLAMNSCPSWRRHVCELHNINHALMKAVLHVQQGQVFLDSSKQPHRLKFLMQIPGVRTRVIHLVRDGRGVVASYMRKGWTFELSMSEWTRALRSQEAMLRRQKPENVFSLRYEDLCANPEKHVNAVYAFLKLPLPNSKDMARTEHHILGNRMRLNQLDRVEVDEAWKTKLTPTQLDIFKRQCGPMNRRIGYEG